MKLCCVFNYNPHYRFPIYKKMDEEIHPDFFFGDSVFQPLKQFNPYLLKGFKSYIHAKKSVFKGFISYSNTKGIFDKEYTHYIITGSNAMLINWRILLYSRLTGKKVYIWCHGEHNYIKKKWLRLFQRTFYNLATGLLLYQEYSRPYMLELGCKNDRLLYIHNSLDTIVQTIIYNQLKPSNIYRCYFKNDNPTIIYIGRVQKVKKIEQILDALLLLRRRNYFVNFVIVGGNVDFDNIDSVIENSSLSNSIWLYGPCYDEKMNAELLYNAKALISPGNVGLSCIHSLSYGTPVITNDRLETQMPEHGAIVDGVTGSFFKENNIDDLAEKIQFWCNKKVSESTYVREAARKTIQDEWSTDYQIKLLKSIFK